MPAARTFTLRTHSGAYGRDQMKPRTHALANEGHGAVGSACGRIWTLARTSGLTIDAEPLPITCAACRDAS